MKFSLSTMDCGKLPKNTSDDILARLPIVPLVPHERWLDTTPSAVKKHTSAGDDVAAMLHEIIGEEENPNVAAGVKWSDYICARRQLEPAMNFQLLVNKRFNGFFNAAFCYWTLAGFPQNYYEPLATNN